MKLFQSKLVVCLVAAGVVVLIAIFVGRHAMGQPAAGTEPATVPTAGVATVTRADLFREVTIPAEFRPFEEVALHAKVSGYVKEMNVDFGDRVKAGQLIATLEVPELQDQLQSADATEAKAEADLTNATLIHDRLVAVNQDHPNLVAQQELDTAAANAQTTAAALAAAHAEVEKYDTLIDYTKITAPFDGVVTRRYADPGELIQAGTSSDPQASALVRVSDNYRLRLDFPVSVDYVKDIQLGDPVEVRVDSLDGKVLAGKVSRFAGEVDDSTRTMITEIEVTNPDLRLVPGMYATVVLKVDRRPGALAVPVEAVAGVKTRTVMVVNHDNEIEARPVTLGLETPDKYEVLSGLSEGDRVVIGGQGFQPGEKVQAKLLQVSLRE